MVEEIKRIPFGILPLDIGSHGGAPEGRTTIFTGRTRSGKSTVAAHLLAEFQRVDDRKAIVYDLESKVDPRWWEVAGVDWDRVIVEPPDLGEAVLQSILDCAEAKESTWNEVGLIIVDSLRMVVPRMRFDKDSLSKSFFSPDARLLNDFYRNLVVLLDRRRRAGSPCTFLAINHETTGIPSSPMMPPPIIVPGGKAQLYLSHLRVRFLPPKYKEEVVFQGTTYPTLVEFRYKVESTTSAAGGTEGDFTVYQVATNELPIGTINDFDRAWVLGTVNGFIKQSGQKYIIDSTDGEQRSKDEVLRYWQGDPELYHRHKLEILRLDVEAQKKIEKRERKSLKVNLKERA